ncbi:TetR family transcriptional regulator [Mycobacterium lentiflavum]|uniref:TetR family transcriptional regulator n=1 Tax=Mycobacterium lentiflavum TaxID=141349 RepID=A0A0E4H5H4_MYCLN|nr:TetR/AcrR family transcriptional regulator [Mycobacterium lentiflavum]CQD23967.1 TetR family transcriptional regulator [Mycobacterium lentiflavum]
MARSAPYPASLRKADAQRQRVLSESTEMFSRRGFRATSMSEIAAAVGLSKPTLYHYFRSKEELLVRLYSNMLDESLVMGEEIVAAADSPLAAIRNLIASRVAYTCRNRALLKVCFEEEHELPGELFTEVLQRRRAFEELFLAALREHLAQHPGVLVGMTPTVFMNMCLGAANWCYKWFRADGAASPDELGEQIARLLTTSLDPRSRTAQAGRADTTHPPSAADGTGVADRGIFGADTGDDTDHKGRSIPAYVYKKKPDGLGRQADGQRARG